MFKSIAEDNMENRLFTDFDVEISRVLLAHQDTLPPGLTMDRYRLGRNMHGMVCALDGCAEYLFAGERRISLSPGDVAFLPAETAYLLRVGSETSFLHHTVNFLAEASSFPEWIRGNEAYVLRPTDFSLYRTRFEEMSELWRRMRTGYRMQTKARLLSLLADFLTESMTQTVDPGAYNRTLPAKRLIETHYAENLTLQSLSAACNMSEASFRRAFAAVYHQSPVAYLLNLRIEKAKELLLVGYPLEEIAQKTGFSDVNYFIRYFHKITGFTPGRFRQLY